MAFNLTVTETERDLLLRILDTALGEQRVEARRTRAPEWHDQVIEEENVLRHLLDKLRQMTPEAASTRE